MTQIPAGARLRSVAIHDGTARAVFSAELDRGVGGSLRGDDDPAADRGDASADSERRAGGD